MRGLGKRLILRFILAFVFLVGFLFGPAGTFKWLEAWVLIIIYFSWAGFVCFWLKKNNPELLGKRLSLKLSTYYWDKLIIVGATLFFIVQFLVLGFDKRFSWSKVPLWLEGVGFVGMAVSLGLIFWVMRENTFLTRTIEIQKGHQVITTGPYKYVRHPMYAGFIFMIFCLSFSLGSFYSLIPATGINVLIVIRTYFEDKTLQKELSDYKKYSQKTPYKLIPGVW